MDNWSTDKEFIETFRSEAEEHLRNLNEGLMELENSPGSEDLVKKLFREAHTLKGSAGMMGFSSMRDLAHHVEDILAAVQKGQTRLTKDITDLLLESLDRIEELLPVAGETGEEADVSDLIEKLDGVDCSVAPEPAAAKDEPAEQPAVDAADETKPKLQPRVVEPVAAATSQAEVMPAAAPAEDVRRPEPAVVQPANPPARRPQQEKRTDPTIRVNIERLDKLLNLMGEVLVNQMDSEGQVNHLDDIQGQTRELKQAFSQIIRDIDNLKKQVDPSKISGIEQKLHRADESAREILEKMDQTTSSLKDNTANRRIALDELQDRTLHVRMLPISTIFGLYPRVVRDAASSSGKKVRLVTEGDATELDKRILEQVSDPLMHIVRNSADHGIELPSKRDQAGKPEEGTIKLSAHQRGDKVEIIIEDDGAGIDPAKLKQAAVAKGLVGSEGDLSDDEALDLIFQSGFSTASKVTSISGRGVGLDVVKTNIEKLEGSVKIDSTPGQGTRFTVALPVSLAIFAGLLVKCNDSKFVIPLASVQEMVSIRKTEIQTLGNHRGFLKRGHAIPMVDLLQFLGDEETESPGDSIHAVVVGSGKKIMALQVGSFVGEQEVVIKSLGSFLPRLPNIAGITILASGEAVVVLNVTELTSSIRSGRSQASRQLKAVDNRAESDRRVRVLVVEDSLVVRELQRNILESAGYKVQTAVDGEDALAHLAKETVDCVVTDIEMPRMNGFELTAAVRKSEATRETPVIMVSSLSNEEDKQRGMDVGANAYVVKGTFDQHHLLSTIERLVA
ncbi:MAG: hybrid sensor histidine kinase/response regulator [Thermoleophilia bacterium]